MNPLSAVRQSQIFILEQKAASCRRPPDAKHMFPVILARMSEWQTGVGRAPGSGSEPDPASGEVRHVEAVPSVRLASDPITISVHLGSIARLPTIDRGRSRCSGFITSGIVDRRLRGGSRWCGRPVSARASKRPRAREYRGRGNAGEQQEASVHGYG